MMFYQILCICCITGFVTIHATPITWNAESPNNDMNSSANWNPNTVPGNSDIAIFDSTISNIDTSPTEISAGFSVLEFYFPNTASPFIFTFNNQPLSFQGIGISGINVNPTINISNLNNDSSIDSLISFEGSTGTLGSAILTCSNSATLSGSNSGTQLGRINSMFLSSGPFTLASNGEITLTNTATDQSSGDGNNYVSPIETPQMLLNSTVTLGDNCKVTVSNTANNSATTTASGDFVGYLNDYQISLADALQTGNNFNLTLSNVGSDTSSGNGQHQVAAINSNSGSTGGQILLSKGGALGNNASMNISLQGTYSGTNTNGGSNVGVLNEQQVIIGDSSAIGSYNFTAGNNFTFTVSNYGQDSAQGIGGDVVSNVSADQIVFFTPCFLGDQAQITLSNEGNYSGQATSTYVNVGSAGGSQLYCQSTFQAGNYFTLNINNTGTNSGSGVGDYFVGALITGQQAHFHEGLSLGDYASMTLSNSGTNSSSTTSANNIGSLLGYGKQLFVEQDCIIGDHLQMVISNFGFDNSTNAGGNYSGFINNNSADNTGSQIHLSHGATIGNDASITLSNTGTYQGNNTGSNRTGILAGPQFYSATDFLAGDNFFFSVSNSGKNKGSNQSSNAIGQANGPQIEFGATCTLGNNASILISNKGTNNDSQGTGNAIGYINGSQLAITDTFTAGTNLTISATNSRTNGGDSSNNVGYINGSQLLFGALASLNSPSTISATNSGTVTGSQIVFGNGFEVAGGKIQIEAINQGTLGGFGIDIQGSNSGGNVNILLSNNVLYIETTLPSFTICELNGDSTSIAKSKPELIINTDAEVQSVFSGSIQDFPAITSTLRKTGLGTQTLSGTNTYSGLTTIEEGTLIVNGEIAGDVLIDSNGTLKGKGTLSSTVTNTGTISPGTSIGTITVGDYVNNGGTYFVEINGASQSDLIDSTGTTTLNGGTVLVSSADGTIQFQHPYTILTSTSISGSFTNATSTAFINPVLSYDATDVYVTIYSALTNAATACNQYGVATNLDGITNPSSSQNLLIGNIALLPQKEAEKALESLSGFQYTNDIWFTEITTRRLFRRLYDAIRPTVIACNPSSNTWSTWIETGYNFTNMNGKNAHDSLVNSFQTTGGLERNFSFDFTLGLAGSYEYDHTHYKYATGNRNAGFFSIYGLYRPEQFYTLLDLAYGHATNNIHRTIHAGDLSYQATGSPNLNQFALYSEIGYNIRTNSFLTQPFFGIQYGQNWKGQFKETKANGWGLTIDSQNWAATSSRLGLHLSGCNVRKCVDLSFDVAWNQMILPPHNSSQGYFQEFGNSFLVCGNPLDNASIDYALTLLSCLTKNLEGFIEFSGESWLHANTFGATVGFEFSW
jgi:autotransporter-associated beta strand protein